MINDLSGQNREDRIRSRTIIRKIFLQQDKVKITEALNELDSNEWQIAQNTLEWIQLTSNDSSLQCFISLVFEPNEISDGFVIERLGLFKNITKEHLIKNGVGVGDLFQLWLYSGDIHYDKEKAQLLNILKNKMGGFIDAFIDMYTVILAKLSRHVILPIIEGHMEYHSLKTIK